MVWFKFKLNIILLVAYARATDGSFAAALAFLTQQINIAILQIVNYECSHDALIDIIWGCNLISINIENSCECQVRNVCHFRSLHIWTFDEIGVCGFVYLFTLLI